MALLLALFLGLSDALAATVLLEWQASTSPEISNYRVSYGFSSGSYTNTQDVGLNTSLTVGSLSPGQTIYFVVRARNVQGLISDFTEEVAFQVGSGPSPTPTPSPSPSPTPSPSPSPSPSPTPGPTPIPFDPDTDGDGVPNSVDVDDDNDFLLDSLEASLGTDPLNPDSDFDGRSDGEEYYSDLSNPLDGGHVWRILEDENCADWNTVLTDGVVRRTLLNIFEIKNTSNNRSGTGKLKIYSNRGVLLRTESLALAPLQQFDYVLNGKVPDGQIGSVCLEHNMPVDGAMVHYMEDRSGRSKKSFHFAFAMGLSDGSPNEQAVTMNTYQPSLLAEQQGYKIANWATFRNAGKRQGSGVAYVYGMTGLLLTAFPLTLAPGERVDFDLHRFGRNIVGTVVWKPAQLDIPFVIRNIRYLYDNNSWNPTFLTAFPLEARSGSGERQSVALSTAGGKMSVIEISNVLPFPTNVAVKVYLANGLLKLTQTVPLNAYESRHLIMNDVIGKNAYAQAVIQSDARGGAIAYGLEYGFDSRGGLQLMYGNSAESAFGTALRASFNSFLGHANVALIQNTLSSPQNFVISVRNYAGVMRLQPTTMTVPANGLYVLDLNSFVGRDEYGTVVVQAENQNAILGIIERSTSQYAMPLPIRDAGA